jgi:ATP-binding cassette subfamily B (MDR/TAP) protein 1
VFGELIDDFARWQVRQGLIGEITPEELVAKVSSTCLYFVYLAVLTFVTTYLFMAISVYTSLLAAHRIRQKYLKAVLRQDMTFFDKIGAGEVATRITSDTLLVQDAIGEKLPLAFSALATFLSGLVIAFVKSWRLSLVLLLSVPFIGGIAKLT